MTDSRCWIRPDLTFMGNQIRQSSAPVSETLKRLTSVAHRIHMETPGNIATSPVASLN